MATREGGDVRASASDICHTPKTCRVSVGFTAVHNGWNDVRRVMNAAEENRHF